MSVLFLCVLENLLYFYINGNVIEAHMFFLVKKKQTLSYYFWYAYDKWLLNANQIPSWQLR